MFSLSYEKDPSKLQTNSRFPLLAGALYDGSWKSVLMSIYRISFLISGILQYAIKFFFSKDEDSQPALIEALHWMLVYSSVLAMLISCLCKSSLFFQMRAMVKSGFYDYGGMLTEDQIKVRTEANRDIQLSTILFSISCVLALLTSYFKAPLFMGKFSLPYPVWMPLKIRGWWSYLLCMSWLFFMAETMVFCACANWVVYVSLTGHLIAQYRILILAIQGISSLAEKEVAAEKKEQKLLGKIKECVEHHLLLTKFFNDLQLYFDIALLVTAFGTALILCTIGYLIISPQTTTAAIGALLLILVPELCIAGFYCAFGQIIADVTEEVSITIYNLEWYTMPLSVRRDLLMMMIGSKKTRQLTGLGLHEFSIKGLSEILQASFTYFNMLMALSGGK